MKRIDNPHIDVDMGHLGQSGPAGELRGHCHFSCPVEGFAWSCCLCGLVTAHAWDDIDAAALAQLAMFDPDGDLNQDAVALPPCACGALNFVNHSDVMYGLEQPSHYTLKALTEHVTSRPKLKGKFGVNRHAEHERWQGEDYSHLPKAKRPDWHRKIDLHAAGAEHRARYDRRHDEAPDAPQFRDVL